MKSLKFEDRDSWLAARRGKITGSRLKDVVTKRGTGWKVGVYELIAERMGIAPDDESAMDRGHRLEEEALNRFRSETGKKVDSSLVMWCREDEESIAISPDGFMGKTEAVEVKCLGSARHIEAYITKKVPDEYEMQKIQYFAVNDKLKKLYWVFYDPRMPSKDFFYLEILREDVQEDVDTYLMYQHQVLKYVRDTVSELTF